MRPASRGTTFSDPDTNGPAPARYAVGGTMLSDAASLAAFAERASCVLTLGLRSGRKRSATERASR